MSAIATNLYVKRPDDRLDYDVDFSRWMAPGDTIASVSVAIDTSGSMVIDDHTFSNTAVKVWLNLGDDGETAHVTVEATTEAGREKEICFKVRVRERC